MSGKSGKRRFFDQKAPARRWPRKTGKEMETGCMAAINTPNRIAGIAGEPIKSSQANAGLCWLAYRHLQYSSSRCLSALLCRVRAALARTTRERARNLGNRAAGPQGPSRMPCVPEFGEAGTLSRIATVSWLAIQVEKIMGFLFEPFSSPATLVCELLRLLRPMSTVLFGASGLYLGRVGNAPLHGPPSGMGAPIPPSPPVARQG